MFKYFKKTIDFFHNYCYNKGDIRELRGESMENDNTFVCQTGCSSDENMNHSGTTTFTLDGNAIPVGVCIFEFDGEKITLEHASNEYYRIFGYDESEYWALPRNSAGVRFCDDEKANSLFGTFKEAITQNKRFDMEYQGVNRYGTEIYLKSTFKIISVENGIYTISCATTDVSEFRQPQVFSENERERLMAIAALSADTLFEYDIEKDELSCSKNDNGRFVKSRVIKDFESEYKDNSIIFENDIAAFERLCDNMRLGVDNISVELRLYDEKKQAYTWHKFQGKTLNNKDGIPVKIIGKIVNISEDKDAERRLIDKAERDPLTKIYNKATTTTMIKDFLRTDNRETLDALLIIDVDNFKAVNDNLGHLFGDSILLDLSQEMQDLFRSSDVVGRIGGDEFVVFLRGIKQQKHIADKAKDICRIFELLYSGENGDKITGSIGISVFPQDGTNYDDLFKKADIALYTSKNSGKNCFTFYSDCVENPLNENNQIHANKYRKDIPISSPNNIFTSEITDFAFDIMNKTKDVSSAINLLLSKVGKHFGLSRVSVKETVLDQPFCLRYTYQWCANGIESQLGRSFLVNQEQWINTVNKYDDNDIYACENLDKEYDIDPYWESILKKSGVVAFLECAIFDSGEYKGCICFNDCKKIRVWTVDEVRALITISKIISSYLLKMRAFEKANKMVDTLTNFDKLTGLPHLNKFREMVEEIIANAQPGDAFALISADINNFKYLNEKLGSENGDFVLRSFALKLASRKAYKNNNCRVFSDKFLSFVMIDPDVDIKMKFEQVLTTFTDEMKEQLPTSSLTICSGIYIIRDKKNFDFNIATDNVNIARLKAKGYLENTCVVFEDSMKTEINKSIEILTEAHRAIENHEFVVYFQPKIALKSNAIVGAEALVRWKKPDGRIIPPCEFIPYLEKNGFICNVDFYVYEEVCRYIRRKLDAGMDCVPISVNVSRVHLKNDDFIRHVSELVERYHIPHKLLEFELTESVFLENQNAAVKTMTEMKNMGFYVSIDDFGSGFSSLNMLKNLPVDILKIDKEFFGNYSFKTNDEIVISSIIGMANKMSISVICEGVETEEQVNFLRDTECDMVQGYYFGKPIPCEDFDSFKVTNK